MKGIESAGAACVIDSVQTPGGGSPEGAAEVPRSSEKEGSIRALSSNGHRVALETHPRPSPLQVAVH